MTMNTMGALNVLHCSSIPPLVTSYFKDVIQQGARIVVCGVFFLVFFFPLLYLVATNGYITLICHVFPMYQFA